MIAEVARSLVLGYLLPSSILLHQMAVRQSEQLPASFEVAGLVTLTGDEAFKAAAELGLEARSPLAISARFSFAPERCSLELRGGRTLLIADERGQLRGAETGWPAQLARLACLPFLFRGEGGSDSLEALLRRAGGNFEESALTLEDGAVTYVVGAGEQGAGPVGLAIKKRDLVPTRVWQQDGNTRIEVVFGGYRDVFHQGGFPTFLELRANGVTIARFVRTP